MPRYFLTRVSVEGFRGINNEGSPLQLKFQANSVNSVFAVNGIGKSSLFEALCFAIQGKVPKLESLQAQERPQDYYRNRFHSGTSSFIELDLEPDDNPGQIITVRIERNGAGQRIVTSPTGHPNPEDLLQSLNEDFVLLDYGTFSRFIEDSPLVRGRSFSALLGLSSYSDMRQSIQAISDTRALNNDFEIRVLQTNLENAEQHAQGALTSLRVTYEKITGEPFEDINKLETYSDNVVTAMKGISLLSDFFNEKKLEDIDFESVKDVIKTAEDGEKRNELTQTISSITKIQALGEPGSEYGSEQETLASLIDERDKLLAETRGDLFKRMYQNVQSLYEDNVWDKEKTCPLCESELEHSVLDHVNSQLQQYQGVSEKITLIKDSWTNSTWVIRMNALEQAEILKIDDSQKMFKTFGQRAGTGELTKEDLENAIRRGGEVEEIRTEKLAQLNEQKESLENDLPPSLVQLMEQVENVLQFKNSANSYTEKQDDAHSFRERVEIRNRWKDFVAKSSTMFSEAEGNLSKRKINSIDTEYKEMFKHIMNVGDIVPNLQRDAGREDLHVQLSQFHGQSDVSARALLSESYRNALAISVFLATALKHIGAPRFIVLDDVTSSFDAGHQYNLMELIRAKLQQPSNSSGLQFLILSHDGLLEKYFDRLGGTGGWCHHRLQGSPPMGAVLNQSQDSARLKVNIETFLNAGQVNQAENLIRQYLEYVLQKIIRRVHIPVPIDFAIKDHAKMVQNCLDAITSAVNLHQSAGSLVLESGQINDLDSVHVPALIGNWVSHYATGGTSSFSAPVLRGVMQTIADLEECFKYDDNSSGSVVRKWYRSLDRR